MSRWADDARERLERAAIELFLERGFTATTVPEITARAGLTTRTFYRHFSDKREVLFGGGEIAAWAADMIAEAPASWAPMRIIAEGLAEVAASRFEGRREELRALRQVVRSDDGLRERELRKWADLTEASRVAFVTRGIEPVRAALLAQIGIVMLRVSVEDWLGRDDDRALTAILRDAFTALRDEFA
ncbi:TetR family transcriptional regulator [Streptomyces sp. SID2888]|uniref:TetR family transcriptional regulator n=1 Tax=Streptomyces sp. SID2888 TaxID=2690256 RepID=UPI001369EB36|nr:TetR family transcriptional regulator [Streptomyces sp. SID2888]